MGSPLVGHLPQDGCKSQSGLDIEGRWLSLAFGPVIEPVVHQDQMRVLEVLTVDMRWVSDLHVRCLAQRKLKHGP